MADNNEVVLVVSALSLGLAGLSLGWNIYRDVVLKPRAKVSIDHVVVAPPHAPRSQQLKISAVNHGPGIIRLNIIRFRHATFWQRIIRSWRHGVLLHDWENPLSGQLPTSLEVGEAVDLLFPWQQDNLLESRPTHVGITDSFGRTHWCSKKQIAKAQQKWDTDFASGVESDSA